MGKRKFDKDEARLKYYDYLNLRIPKKISKLKEDGDSSDVLLLQNHIHELRDYEYEPGKEFHLRIDSEIDTEMLEKFLERFKDTIQFMYAYHEISTKKEKPHYHIHIKYLEEIVVNSIRVSYQRFFKKDGSELSFSMDSGLSRVYTTKDKNRQFSYNISENAIRIYELISERKVDKEERKKIIKESGKTPMELFEDAFRLECQNRCDIYNHEHLNKRDVSYYYTDDFIADFTMHWYANHLHKSFMIQKMAECAMYLRYRLHHTLDNPDPISKKKLLEKMFS